jgi:hypothetical protein
MFSPSLFTKQQMELLFDHSTKFEPHTGDAVCTVCGAALESWWNSTHVAQGVEPREAAAG